MRAISARPLDDLPRLVYADWLEEQGDPDRAEFIRVQIARANETDGKGDLPGSEVARIEARDRVLLGRNRERWTKPLSDLGVRSIVQGGFWRGFMNGLSMDAEAFLAHGEQLWLHSPVQSLRLTNVRQVGRRLSQCPHLSNVRNLELSGSPPISVASLRAFLESPFLTGLERLCLSDIPLRDRDIASLTKGSMLPSIRDLHICSAQFRGDTVPDFLSRFPYLESLGMSSNSVFEARCWGEIVPALNPATFRKVIGRHNAFGVAGMTAFANAKAHTQLSGIWLSRCGLDARAFEVLATATHLTKVTAIQLGFDPISEAGGIALASWPGLKAVRRLEILRGELGPAGAAALVRSPRLGPLTALWLRGDTIGDDAVEAIASNDQLKELTALYLSDNAITEVGARAIASSPFLRQLRKLHLDRNSIGDEGARAIARAPHLRSLRWLSLDNNQITRAVGRELIAAFPELAYLSADAGLLSSEHLDAVREGLAAGGTDADVHAAVEDRMVQAILDIPNDMKPREMYGSFLHNAGSPWWVVISLQNPEFSAPAEVEQRWRGWFEAGRDEWLAPLLPWVEMFDDADSFDRGFLRKVHFHTPLPDEVAESLARFPPLALLPVEVQRGHMTGEGAFQILAHRRCLARISRLEFTRVTTNELEHVLKSSYLSGLEELAFGPCDLDDEVARLLASTPGLSRLKSLDFGWNAAPTVEQSNRVGIEGLNALGSSPHLTAIQELGLQGNPSVDDRAIGVLLTAPNFTNLVSLDLRDTSVTDVGLRRLAESSLGQSLEVLRS